LTKETKIKEQQLPVFTQKRAFHVLSKLLQPITFQVVSKVDRDHLIS